MEIEIIGILMTITVLSVLCWFFRTIEKLEA